MLTYRVARTMLCYKKVSPRWLKRLERSVGPESKSLICRLLWPLSRDIGKPFMNVKQDHFMGRFVLEEISLAAV